MNYPSADVSAIDVSAATASITPQQLGVELAGYNRDAANAIHDPIEANGILFRQGDGKTAIILTLDTLYVGADLTNRLQRYVHERLGAEKAELLAFASHTHFAPALDRSKPNLGKVDDDYFEWVATRCEGLIDELLGARSREASVRGVESNWFGAVHRRKPWPLPYKIDGKLVFGEPLLAPNPRGPTDPVVRLWEVGVGRDRIALIWSCACHPTSHVRLTDISADYCGVVRDALRRAIGAPIPVLFLQGFTGDLRPSTPSRWRLSLRAIVKLLLYGPRFDPFTAERATDWRESLARVVLDMLGDRAVQSNRLAGQIAWATTETALSELIAEAYVGARTVTFKRLKVGNLFDIIGVAAEPSNQLRRLIPDRGVLPIGYLGDVFGYWPTEAQRKEGGYEARRFLPVFGFPGGRLVGDLDQKFIDCLPRLHGERPVRRCESNS